MRRVAIVALLLTGCYEAGTEPVAPVETEAEKKDAAPREMRLVSEDGTQELVLTPAGITIVRQGEPRVEITAGDASTTLVLRDSGGRRRAQLLVTDGPIALSLLNPDERDAAVMAGNERDALGRVELFGGSGQARAGLAVGRDGKGSMTMIGTAMEMPAATPVVVQTPKAAGTGAPVSPKATPTATP